MRQTAEKSVGSVRRRPESRSDAHSLDSELTLTQPLTLGRLVSITIFFVLLFLLLFEPQFHHMHRIIFVLHWEILRVK